MSLSLRVCVRPCARARVKTENGREREKREVLGYRGERQGEGKNRGGGVGGAAGKDA